MGSPQSGNILGVQLELLSLILHSTSIMTDKYLGSQYAKTDISYPYFQALRGEVDPSHCGYFIPLSQLEKSSWHTELKAENMTTYTYNNGMAEVGLLLTSPRMIINPISPLMMFDRASSTKAETLVVLGEWNRTLSDDPNIGNYQVYLIIFLDENNQPLHDIPFRFTAKGAQQASLNAQWQLLCTAVARCQASAAKTRFYPRNNAYNMLCIFQPIIARKLVGTKTKSLCCYIDGFVAPTMDNWRSFFVGIDENLADFMIEIINPQVQNQLPGEVNPIALENNAIDINSSTVIEDEAIPY